MQDNKHLRLVTTTSNGRLDRTVKILFCLKSFSRCILVFLHVKFVLLEFVMPLFVPCLISSVRVDGFHKSINNKLQSWLGKNCILNLAPVCIIASTELTEHIIYTNSELEMMEFFEIQVSLVPFLLY